MLVLLSSLPQGIGDSIVASPPVARLLKLEGPSFLLYCIVLYCNMNKQPVGLLLCRDFIKGLQYRQSAVGWC